MPPDNWSIYLGQKTTGDKIAGLRRSCGEFVIRKSEPILTGELRAEQAGLFVGAAGRLHLIEKAKILLHTAITAALIDGEEMDAVRVRGNGSCGYVVLNGARPIEAKVIAGDGLGEPTLAIGFRMKV